MFGSIRDKIMGRGAEPVQEDTDESAAPDVPAIPLGVMSLGNTNFTRTIKQYPLTVVDFWAPWCGPCKVISPIVEQFSKSYAGKVAFGKVNVDKEKWVASSFRIRSIPTIMLFSRGHTVDRIVGAVPKSVIDSKIKRHLSGQDRP